VIFPRYGIMAPSKQVYPTIDFESFQGYPHYLDIKWLNNSPRFGGLPITHIVEFFKYINEIEFEEEDVLVKLFILSCHLFYKIGFVKFSNPNPVSVSLIFQPMLNAQTQFYISI
jgi:hypothetical protein